MLLLAVLLCALLALCAYIEDRFDPILDELAEYEACAAVVQAVNGTVTQELARDPQAYTGLYQLQYDADGALLAIIADTAAMNRTRQQLVAAVEAALQQQPERTVLVPFGTLTGFSLFNGLGPGWALHLRPQAYVESSIRERTESVPINRTRYTAELVLELTINLVLDGKNRVLHRQTAIPVASVVAEGGVPLLYSG